MVAPVREWNLKNVQDKLNYARRRRLPITDVETGPVVVDRNLSGASVYINDLNDSWETPADDVFVMTTSPDKCPDAAEELVIGWDKGCPARSTAQRWSLCLWAPS